MTDTNPTTQYVITKPPTYANGVSFRHLRIGDVVTVAPGSAIDRPDPQGDIRITTAAGNTYWLLAEALTPLGDFTHVVTAEPFWTDSLGVRNSWGVRGRLVLVQLGDLVTLRARHTYGGRPQVSVATSSREAAPAGVYYDDSIFTPINRPAAPVEAPKPESLPVGTVVRIAKGATYDEGDEVDFDTDRERLAKIVRSIDSDGDYYVEPIDDADDDGASYIASRFVSKAVLTLADFPVGTKVRVAAGADGTYFGQETDGAVVNTDDSTRPLVRARARGGRLIDQWTYIADLTILAPAPAAEAGTAAAAEEPVVATVEVELEPVKATVTEDAVRAAFEQLRTEFRHPNAPSVLSLARAFDAFAS